VQSLEAKRGELPVELLATVRIGPLLFAMLFYPVAIIVTLVLRVPGSEVNAYLWRTGCFHVGLCPRVGCAIEGWAGDGLV